MEILKTFGLDWQLLAAQIVNFLIILYVLKRFLYPPLFKVFKKREELVKESIEKAQENEKILEKSKEQEKEILKKARVSANEIIKDANERSDEVVKKAEVEAKNKSDKMLIDAKEQIELEKMEAQKQLNKYVLQLSLDLLQKTLSNVFTEKEQSELVERAIKVMQKQPN